MVACTTIMNFMAVCERFWCKGGFFPVIINSNVCVTIFFTNTQEPEKAYDKKEELYMYQIVNCKNPDPCLRGF